MGNSIRTVIHDQRRRDETLEVEVEPGSNKGVVRLALELWALEAKVSLKSGVLCVDRKRTDDGSVLKWDVFHGNPARLSNLLRDLDLIRSVVQSAPGHALVRFKRPYSERLQDYLETMTGVAAVSSGSSQDKHELLLRVPDLVLPQFEAHLREHLRFGL